MLLYNIRIAAKSLRRNPYLTAVLLAAIALGICISTTFTTLRHAFARDPMPDRSDKIFYVRMDNWDPAEAYPDGGPNPVPTQISYPDMRELMKSPIPVRQSGSFITTLFITPDPKAGRPYEETIRMVFSDFFPMFEVPFQYGSGWDKRADAKPEPVVVIDDATNKKLFGGVNSVGRTVHIDDRDFKVAGVLAPWRPAVRYFDMTGFAAAAPDAVYMPFNFTPLMKIRTRGNSDGWRSGSITTFEEFLGAADIDWIQFWVEIPTPEKQGAYRDFMDNYVRDQRKRGRFQRPLNNRLTDLRETMSDFKVVRPQFNAMAAVSVLFLAVCSLNLVGLLLGKFLARAPEVSVRRALGASRWQVFLQHIVECEVVGLIGGAIGVLLSIGTVALLSKVMPGNVPIHLDTTMIVIAVLLSLVAGFVAGVYPAWRICTMPPAMQLKLQ
jgi:putative ABC transport system permease protein